MNPISVAWRTFTHLLRRQLATVGVMFLCIAGFSGWQLVSQFGWQPVTGVVVAAERSGAGYESKVLVTRDSVTTLVSMDLHRTSAGAPRPGLVLDLVQNPSDPTDVALLSATATRLVPTLGFGAGGFVLLWFGLGARLPQRKKPIVSAPARSTAKAHAWQPPPAPPAPASRPSAVVDNSRARLQASAGSRRVFGSRGV